MRNVYKNFDAVFLIVIKWIFLTALSQIATTKAQHKSATAQQNNKHSNNTAQQQQLSNNDHSNNTAQQQYHTTTTNIFNLQKEQKARH